MNGGDSNQALGTASSVSGGYINRTWGDYSTVGGGYGRGVAGAFEWRAGDLFQYH